ncbi:MAG: hypothetical protein AAGD96_31550 [Chloroflexota bacterium]
MAKNSKKRNKKNRRPAGSMNNILFAVGVPLFGSLLLGQALIALTGASTNGISRSSIILGSIGLISMFYGMQKYKTVGMGLRGGRPLFSSAGFAFMGWVGVLICRLFFVEIDPNALNQPLFSIFFYLLLFEAFAVQVWAFSLVFKSVADAYGGVAAAIASGLAFANVAFFYFQEIAFLSPVINNSGWILVLTVFYVLTWGIFYGMVRLRTGSILGIVLVQAMQSLTAWELIPPLPVLDNTNFNSLFFIMIGIYGILIWRLWPKELSDHRI